MSKRKNQNPKMPKKTKSKQYRNFCITIFNYNLEVVRPLLDNSSKIKCYQYQEEFSKEKRRHLQLYVEFKTKRTFVGVKRYFKDNTLHVENRRGSKLQAVDYCRKEDTRIEGTEPHSYNISMRGGRRPALQDSITEYLNGKISRREFINKYPVYGIRSIKQLQEEKEIREQDDYIQTLALKLDKAVLKDWQKTCIEKYMSQGDRKVLWIYDPVGNTGKTWLGRYLMIKLKDVYKINTCSYKDIAYAYKKQKNVIFDYSRSQCEYFNYMAMESLKNGEMFSGKYHSHQVIFSPAKVLVFANYPPDVTKLSVDRWDIYKIQKNTLKRQDYQKFIVPLMEGSSQLDYGRPQTVSHYKSIGSKKHKLERNITVTDSVSYHLTT